MEYIFKERIPYNDYLNFIKNYNFLSYYQEDNYAKAKNIKERFIVGVYKNNKLVAVSQIFINSRKKKYSFFIPHGYLVDYTDNELINFMTKNIYLLARKYKAYVIDLYPNISIKNNYLNTVNKNLVTSGYKYKNEYFDSSINLLIPLKENNKLIPLNSLKKLYDKEDKYLKYGVSFCIGNSNEMINIVDKINDKEYFNIDLLKNLVNNFDNRVKIILAKIDLVFYRHYLEENNGDEVELNNINELILSGTDEYYIGCATIIEPINNKNNYVELIYNEVVYPFDKLEIMNGLIYETMKIAHKKKYDYIKLSNLDLNANEYIKKYNAIEIKYIGHYYLVTNKLSYFLNREHEKRRLFV